MNWLDKYILKPLLFDVHKKTQTYTC